MTGFLDEPNITFRLSGLGDASWPVIAANIIPVPTYFASLWSYNSCETVKVDILRSLFFQCFTF